MTPPRSPLDDGRRDALRLVVLVLAAVLTSLCGDAATAQALLGVLTSVL